MERKYGKGFEHYTKEEQVRPGEDEILSFNIPARYLAVYNEEKAAWTLQQGENKLYLAGS